ERPADRSAAPAHVDHGEDPTGRSGPPHRHSRRSDPGHRGDAGPPAIEQLQSRLGRRDAYLYIAAATLGSFGLGVTAFYLNFLYRALGYDGLALGALVGAQALGVAFGVLIARFAAPGRSRKLVIIALGGIVGASSAIPVLLIRDVAVSRATSGRLGRLIARFALVEMVFGFGAGSFIPFINLFFADRFALDFRAIGVALGTIAVAGSLGALVHGRIVASRIGPVPAVAAVVAASTPFALVAALTGNVVVAVAALAVRAMFMYGTQAAWSAYQLSSFTPAE